MLYLILWPLLIGIAPLAIPITGHLISASIQFLGWAPDEGQREPVEGERPPRRARSRHPRSTGGSAWGSRPWGPIRVDGGEGKRHQPVRLRLPSR